MNFFFFAGVQTTNGLIEKIETNKETDIKNKLCQIEVIENGAKFSDKNDDREEVIEKGEVEATKEKEKDGEKEKKDDQEILFIQDMGFTVKIVSPGTEAFDIQVRIQEYQRR